MQRNSIQRRLIATVVLSQALLTAGLVLTGVLYTYWQLLSTLDTSMQARALSLAALVRYNDNATGDVYFDDTMLPSSIDPSRPDVFAVWAKRSGLLARSDVWPANVELSPGTDQHWNATWGNVPYHVLRLSNIPILDRVEGPLSRGPQTLSIIYASPTVRLRQQVRAAGIVIALASLVLLALMAKLALRAVRKGLSPLQSLAEQAALVSTQDWQLRLPADVEETAEIQPVAQSLRETLARLQRSFVQQREFLANAAHELKTPVAVLKSTLQSLLQRPRSSEEYRTGLQQSLEDIERLERLLQWMLRLARAEQWAHGALRRDLELIDLNSNCEEAIERIQGLAQSRHTEIVLSRNGPLPFRGDPEDLRLVWTNLLENAVRYSPEGSKVEVALTKTDPAVALLTFKDHGVGIPSNELPHIFERFYRGDPSRTRATGGFGLGLAIAKALIEAYGGTISAESTPGKGTSMSVKLPLHTN
jgi:heavy metal sensor kinase